MRLIRIDHTGRGRCGGHVGHPLHAGTEVGHPRRTRHGHQGQQKGCPGHRPRTAQADAHGGPQHQAGPEQPRPGHIARCGQLRGVVGKVGPAAQCDQPAHGQAEPCHRQPHRFPRPGAAAALPGAPGHAEQSSQPRSTHQQMRPARGQHRPELCLIGARHGMNHAAHGRERQLLRRCRIQCRPSQIDEGRGQPAQQHVQLRQRGKCHLCRHASPPHAQVQPDRHEQAGDPGQPVRHRRSPHHQHRRQPHEHGHAAAEGERRCHAAHGGHYRAATIATQQKGDARHQRHGDQVRVDRFVGMGERALAAQPEDRQRCDQGGGGAHRRRQGIDPDDPGEQPYRRQCQRNAGTDLQPLIAVQPLQLGVAHQVRQDFAVAIVRHQHVARPRHLQQLLGEAPRIGVQHAR